MTLNRFLKIKEQVNPQGLLNLMVKAAFVSVIIVVLVGSFGFYRAFSSFVIKSAEVDSIQLCRVLIDEEKDSIFVKPPDKPIQLRLARDYSPAFDSHLKYHLAPYNIIKVKVYNTEKQIVYSTDATLIGKTDEHNIRLKNALNGAVDAKMVTKDKASDLADEPLRDVDVVETYVPIFGPDNRILGSFEVYMNITEYRQKIRHGVIIATSFLTLIIMAVFGFSYVLIRRAIIQLKESQAQLELVAITDPLTGIHNRRHLMSRAEEEFERVRRSSRPLGCMMLDLDYFKMVNDTKGHVAGDCVLKFVAQLLRSTLRQYDVAGRYGGEEFMVLLPDTTLEQSLIYANRICAAIRSEPIEADGDFLPITVSVGVSVHRKTDLCLSDMIKRADEGLYIAKAAGRDRVAWVGQRKQP